MYGGGTTHKSSLFCYPIIFPDHVGSVVQRVRLREVLLFDDCGQFIEGVNRPFHEHLRNARHEEVKAVIELLEWLVQVADGTVFPEERMTSSLECQRDDKISQRGFQPVVLGCSFLEVLISQGDVLVNDRLHVFWGEKPVIHWEEGLLHQWSVCKPVNQDICALATGKIGKIEGFTNSSLIMKTSVCILANIWGKLNFCYGNRARQCAE